MSAESNKRNSDQRSSQAQVPEGLSDRSISSWWIVIGLFAACILLLCLLAWLVPSAAAMQPGTVTYYSNISLPNDVFELQAQPGDSLLQGRSYDLTKVYGFTGAFAHWNHYDDAGMTCTPDYVINTSYIKTDGKVSPKNVYLDPTQWPKGDWYQWDGCYDAGPQKGKKTADWQPYINDDNLMFTVINYSTDYQIIKRWEASRAELMGIRGASSAYNTPVPTVTSTLKIRGQH